VIATFLVFSFRNTGVPLEGHSLFLILVKSFFLAIQAFFHIPFYFRAPSLGPRNTRISTQFLTNGFPNFFSGAGAIPQHDLPHRDINGTLNLYYVPRSLFPALQGRSDERQHFSLSLPHFPVPPT